MALDRGKSSAAQATIRSPSTMTSTAFTAPHDVNVVLEGGQQAGAYRADLCKHSKIFQRQLAMEQHQESDGGGLVTLKAALMSLEVFSTIINFFSTGHLPLEVNLEKCLKLLDTALVYKMGVLRDHLIGKIGELMRSEAEVLKVLQFSVNEDVAELYDHAVGAICLEPHLYLETKAFHKLRFTDALTILEREDLKVQEEVQVFQAALGWAQYKFMHNNSERKEPVGYFFMMLFHSIRFQFIETKDLYYLVKKYSDELSGPAIDVMKDILIELLMKKEAQQIAERNGIKSWRRGDLQTAKEKRPDLSNKVMAVKDSKMLKTFTVPSRSAAGDGGDSWTTSPIACSSSSGFISRGGSTGVPSGGESSQHDSFEEEKRDSAAWESLDREPERDTGEHDPPIIIELRNEPMDLDCVENACGGSVEDGETGVTIDENLEMQVDTAQGEEEGELQVDMAQGDGEMQVDTAHVDGEFHVDTAPWDEEVEVQVTAASVASCFGASNERSSCVDFASLASNAPSAEEVGTPRFMEVTDTPREENPVEDTFAECIQSGSSDDTFDFILSKPDSKNSFPDFTNLLTVALREKPKDVITAGVNLEGFKLRNSHKVVEVMDEADIFIDGTLKFLERGVPNFHRIQLFLLAFIQNFDVLAYLVFKPHEHIRKPIRAKYIWGSKQDIVLRFNGITFLRVEHEDNRVVLNYLRQSRDILKGCDGTVEKIGVSNSEFSLAYVRSQNVTELYLHRVWGEFELEALFEQCQNLRVLCVWKFQPEGQDEEEADVEASFQTLLLNFQDKNFPFHCLRELVLTNVEITDFKGARRGGTSVEVLKLEECTFKAKNKRFKICNAFKHLFPKLKKAYLVGFKGRNERCHCDVTSVHTVYGLLQSPFLEFLRVVNLRWDCDYSSCDCNQDLSEMLKLCDVGESSNFLIERDVDSDSDREETDDEDKWREGWSGRCYEKMEKKDPIEYRDLCDQWEYEWHHLEMFFSGLESFQDYFIQGDVEGRQFPDLQPSFWI